MRDALSLLSPFLSQEQEEDEEEEEEEEDEEEEEREGEREGEEDRERERREEREEKEKEKKKDSAKKPSKEEKIDVKEINLAASTAFLDEEEPEEEELFFTVPACDGTEVPLFPGGQNIRVLTLADRIQYLRRLEAFVNYETFQQVLAVRQGFVGLLPLFFLNYVSSYEFEILVCGARTVTAPALLAATDMSGFEAAPAMATHFQTVVREMSEPERALLLRFMCGLSRLPSTPTKRLRVVFDGGEVNDTKLPRASTCFWTLFIPPYSSLAVLRERLLLSIKSCADLDADFRV